MAEPLLRALELTIRRRVEGLLLGDHRATTLGPGSELAQLRAYEAGDDVRLIDWNATARTGEPHVRVQVAERALTTWLALDRSPSMAFGTADRRKTDVAEGVAAALGRVATRRGNRLGVVDFGAPGTHVRPAQQGRPGELGLRRVVREDVPLDAVDGRPPDSLRDALGTLARVSRRGALAVVVSDFRGPLDWERPLRDLGAARALVAVEVRDPREGELPDVGVLDLVDPETGRRLRVDTTSRKLRARFAERADLEREEVARALRRAGADHVVLTTGGDWLRVFARELRRLEARR